ERTARHLRVAALVEVLGQRFPLEPLEDDERRPRPARRRDRAERDRADDVERRLRQDVEQARLVLELREDAVLRGRVELGHLECLDRDRLLERQVVALVHDAEAPFADDLVDAVLAVEDLPDQAEGVEVHEVEATVSGEVRTSSISSVKRVSLWLPS